MQRGPPQGQPGSSSSRAQQSAGGSSDGAHARSRRHQAEGIRHRAGQASGGSGPTPVCHPALPPAGGPLTEDVGQPHFDALQAARHLAGYDVCDQVAAPLEAGQRQLVLPPHHAARGGGKWQWRRRRGGACDQQQHRGQEGGYSGPGKCPGECQSEGRAAAATRSRRTRGGVGSGAAGATGNSTRLTCVKNFAIN